MKFEKGGRGINIDFGQLYTPLELSVLNNRQLGRYFKTISYTIFKLLTFLKNLNAIYHSFLIALIYFKYAEVVQYIPV
jgi:hypothetical protein